VNVPLSDGGLFSRQLRDLDSIPWSVSDDAVVRLVASAFARSPLGSDEMRDIRVIAFLLDVSSRMSSAALQHQAEDESRAIVIDDRVGLVTGLSNQRLSRGVARLLEARALEHSVDDPSQWFRLSSAVMQPAGADQYVDWQAVIPKIAGHNAAILLLRVVLDLVAVPWEWTRLTYDRLAARAAYSLGMAQRGVSQLLEFGVLERDGHLGRGHDYRLSSWALGRGPALIQEETLAQQTSSGTTTAVRTSTPVSVKSSPAPGIAGTSTMAVEIGGLVLRVPVGTEIQMTVGPNGEMQYQVGSELKITPRR
jgi:hypothetical protein